MDKHSLLSQIPLIPSNRLQQKQPYHYKTQSPSSSSNHPNNPNHTSNNHLLSTSNLIQLEEIWSKWTDHHFESSNNSTTTSSNSSSTLNNPSLENIEHEWLDLVYHHTTRSSTWDWEAIFHGDKDSSSNDNREDDEEKLWKDAFKRLNLIYKHLKH